MGPALMVRPQEEGDISMMTSQECGECGEGIAFTEEIVLLQVVHANLHDGKVLLHPVLDDEGNFLYEPYFIQFPCWEDIQDVLLDDISDTPPVQDPLGPIKCQYCKSSIRPWERCGSVTFGELHISKRAPQQAHGEQLVELGDPYIVCIGCLNLINNNITEFWDEGVHENAECDDCIHGRCWRMPACPCTCHHEDSHHG